MIALTFPFPRRGHCSLPRIGFPTWPRKLLALRIFTAHTHFHRPWLLWCNATRGLRGDYAEITRRLPLLGLLWLDALGSLVVHVENHRVFCLHVWFFSLSLQGLCVNPFNVTSGPWVWLVITVPVAMGRLRKYSTPGVSRSLSNPKHARWGLAEHLCTFWAKRWFSQYMYSIYTVSTLKVWPLQT